MKKVAIVILEYSGTKDTIECLKSINDVFVNDFALLTIVVDNASEKKFKIDNFKFTNGDLKIIRNEKNLGFSGGNNVGISYALENEATHVVILNNDTIVDVDFINQLLHVADSRENIGIVAPKIYFEKGFEYHKDRYKKEDLGKIIWYAGGVMDWENALGFHKGVDKVDRGDFGNIETTEFASGCCMMVKREVFEKIGVFDEKYFLYYEDNDFCQKAKNLGYKILFVPDSVTWHKNAGSSGGSGSNLQDYYITRNRMLFGMRYAPIRTKIALIKESIIILLKGRDFQKKGIIDFYLRKFGKGSYK